MSAAAQLEAALLAMKPDWALTIEVRHQFNFDAAMCFNLDGKIAVASAFDRATVAAAVEAAVANRQRQIDAAHGRSDIAAAEIASWTLADAVRECAA